MTHRPKLSEEEVQQVTNLYPDRIICAVDARDTQDPPMDKRKFVVPAEIQFGNFVAVVRKRLKIKEQEALFFFVDSSLIQMSKTMNEIKTSHASEDGVVYVVYSKENTFGFLS